MRKLGWIVNIGLLFGTLILFFGGIEVVLRLTGLVKMYDYTPPIYRKSDNLKISYTLKPNIRERAFRHIVTTNRFGFRSPPLDFEKDTIVLLGDSITFGYGVKDEETLSARLQELLPTYNVLNAGVPGYHIGQEVALYKQKIDALGPDVLILIFYWGDVHQQTYWLDAKGVLRAEDWRLEDRLCTPIDQGILSLLPGKCWLDLRSALYKGIKQFVETRSQIEQRDERRKKAPISPPSDAEEEDYFLTYERKLAELPPVAPRRRMFVIWPDADLHVHAREKLKEIAERHGFVVLDLYDHFGNKMETLSWDYTHPSAQSLKEVANIFARTLKELLQ